VRELLTDLNRRPFRKRREDSRTSLFERIDKPALQPLPTRHTSREFRAELWGRLRKSSRRGSHVGNDFGRGIFATQGRQLGLGPFGSSAGLGQEGGE